MASFIRVTESRLTTFYMRISLVLLRDCRLVAALGPGAGCRGCRAPIGGNSSNKGKGQNAPAGILPIAV